MKVGQKVKHNITDKVALDEISDYGDFDGAKFKVKLFRRCVCIV